MKFRRYCALSTVAHLLFSCYAIQTLGVLNNVEWLAIRCFLESRGLKIGPPRTSLAKGKVSGFPRTCAAPPQPVLSRRVEGSFGLSPRHTCPKLLPMECKFKYACHDKRTKIFHHTATLLITPRGIPDLMESTRMLVMSAPRSVKTGIIQPRGISLRKQQIMETLQ